MKRHSRPKPSIRQRDTRMTPLEHLESGLQTPDEAAWYAERCERLGRALFGDLWDSEKTESAQTNQCVGPK